MCLIEEPSWRAPRTLARRQTQMVDLTRRRGRPQKGLAAEGDLRSFASIRREMERGSARAGGDAAGVDYSSKFR